METEDKKKIIEYFLEKGILISSDFLEQVNETTNFEDISKLLQDKGGQKGLLILNKDIESSLKKQEGVNINWRELEKSKALSEKGKTGKQYEKFLDYLSEEPTPADKDDKTENSTRVKVIDSYSGESNKRTVSDFVQFFNARFKAIERILRTRQELQNMTSINRIIAKRDKENISLIGLVSSKQITKNQNIVLVIEDTTASIKVLVNKNKPALYEAAKAIVLDEIIGVAGVNGDRIVFANNLIWPDIPMHKELKKSPDEGYAAFISDMHVGSSYFLSDEFDKFLKWIKGETGNEQQRAIASNMKYLFIAGDLIDGCGIYPGQEKELLISDARLQYEECANLLRQIPSHIQIIICAGNHDAMRIAEPQPPLYKDFAASIYELSNVTVVSNPAVVNIHASPDFSGFNVLLYHGYSFDYYANNVDALRIGGGYNRADLIMKYLLQRRHLAPTHTSTQYIPDANHDPLIISTIPDFFITGHIHYSVAANYRNISMISCSCWQSKTSFQEKMGHEPQPARVPVVNLQTRKIKILRFGG